MALGERIRASVPRPFTKVAVKHFQLARAQSLSVAGRFVEGMPSLMRFFRDLMGSRFPSLASLSNELEFPTSKEPLPRPRDGRTF
jgi:hypothetical protein